MIAKQECSASARDI
jgi:hypothetical protein